MVRHLLSLEGFQCGQADYPTRSWFSLCLKAFAMVCSWGCWKALLMQIPGTARMDVQFGDVKQSYGQQCRKRWPRVGSWAHLPSQHLLSSSANQLVLFPNVTQLNLGSFIIYRILSVVAP